MRLCLEVLEDRRVPSTVWYVNAAATGGNAGQSWGNAFTDLQSALKASQSGDQIWVAQGTYKPTSSTDRTISFALKSSVQVYGGFTGTETLLTQRDPVHHVTKLSGDIGTPGDNSDNSYHVVSSSFVSGSTLLDGFTITAGAASGSSAANAAGIGSGGGLFNIGGSLGLVNLTFSNNSAYFNGGGLYSTGNPVLANVTFSKNSAGSDGGGMYNHGFPSLSNVTFNSNSATGGEGGGMYNESGSPALTNVTFSNNSAYLGGGLFNHLSSSPRLTNTTFSGNSASYGGGMVNDQNSSPSLTNSTFSGNSADQYGGGMYNGHNSSPRLTNVTFNGNSAGFNGGGMENNGSYPTLTNAIFYGNSADFGGGMSNQDSAVTLMNATFNGNTGAPSGTSVIDNTNSGVTLTNCIVWGNATPSGGSQFYGGTLSISYSDIQGGSDGTGNINANPLFVDAAHGNLHLRRGSPAIDKGTNSNAPAFDRDNLPRPFDGDGDGTATTDMGAFEFQHVATPTALLCTSMSTLFSTATQTVILRASITPSNNSASSSVNEGSVTFTVLDASSNTLATLSGNAVSGGNASVKYSFSGLAAGSYHIHAAYLPGAGNTDFAPSEDSSDGTLTVARDNTTTAPASLSKVFSSASQVVMLSATIKPANAAAKGEVNEGTVIFTVLDASNHPLATLSDNPVLHGSASAGYDLAGLPTGTYQIRAAYVPATSDPNFTNSQSKTGGTLTVAKDSTTTTVASTGLNATFSTASQKVTLSAMVKAGNTAVGGVVNEGNVTFTILNASNKTVARLSGNTVSGGSASVSYDLAGLPAGSYHIRAAYVPAASKPNFTSSQDKTDGTLAVTKDSSTMMVTSTSLGRPFSNSSQTVTFSALVTPGNSSAGGEVDEGTVMFTIVDGNNRPVGSLVTSRTVSQGVVSVSYTLPARTPVGMYFIHAVYVPKTGNPDFFASADTSNSHTLTISEM